MEKKKKKRMEKIIPVIANFLKKESEVSSERTRFADDTMGHRLYIVARQI